MEKTNLSRRRFVIGSAAAGGGLALGLHVPLADAQTAVYSRASGDCWKRATTLAVPNSGAQEAHTAPRLAVARKATIVSAMLGR